MKSWAPGRLARQFFSSIVFRVLASIITIIVVVSAAYSMVSFVLVRDRWTSLTYDCADRTSELVKAATHYGMLLNRKEEVHHTIRQIAGSQGVAGIRIFNKSGTIVFSADAAQIGQTVNETTDACLGCHQDNLPKSELSQAGRARTYTTPEGETILAVINPIHNDPECGNGGCHANAGEGAILGVLDVQMSLAGMEAELQKSQFHMVWMTVLLILLIGAGAMVSMVLWVRRPLRKLYAGTTAVARGDLSTRIDIQGHDEIGSVARGFNKMATDLERAREELTQWSETLEEKVIEKTRELGRAEQQVLRMDKLASLGKLSATVAHELNNPLAGILNYSMLAQRTIEESTLSSATKTELCRYLDLIAKESGRSGDIVRNLLLFAKRTAVDVQPVGVNEIVERSLMLVRHHLEISNVELKKQLLEGDDTIVCDAGQIQQAVVALLVNAVEAMAPGGGGTIGVTITGDATHVSIEVSDTGQGIAPETLPDIFEPFFSTKNEQAGVGLGLSVVFGIAQAHGGSIEVSSSPQRGTKFCLTVPRGAKSESGEKNGKH